jgi:hypothetical protein
MERLTNSNREIPALIGKNYTYWLKLYWKLKEYEETGVTPDQIRQIDTLYAEKCRELAEVKKQLENITHGGNN